MALGNARECEQKQITNLHEWAMVKVQISLTIVAGALQLQIFGDARESESNRSL